jgi:DamX protein
MVEIDSDTYQVKSMKGEKAAQPRFLITPERNENLGLLHHLLINTHQVIVLCGPEGVGKTGLLEVLQQRLKDELQWCMIKVHGEITFEEVHERVGRLLRHHKPEAEIRNVGHSRSPVFHKNVALVIDDAGKMVPGLVTQLIHLAENHPDLRLLFVLTHDQWHIKNYSDPAIENCYLVEAKPLLQKECRSFIQHLASLTTSLRFRKELTDEMIDDVYRSSHGVPARIIAYFPELNKPKEGIDPLTVLVIAVVCLVSLALYVQWFTATRPINEKTVITGQLNQTHAHFDFQQPIVSLPIGNLLKYGQNSDSTVVQQQGIADIKNIDQVVGNLQAESIPSSLPSAVLPDNLSKTADEQNAVFETTRNTTVPPKPLEESVEQVAEVDNAESWLAAQPESSYSLQLMVLSKKTTAQSVIARYPELQPDLRMVRCILKGNEKFVLLFGGFTDIGSAKNAKKSLPVEFKSSVIRKFGAIRKSFPPESKP